MFDAANISPDYTFTQSERRAYTGNISQALSSYLGGFGVKKTDEDSNEDEKNGILSNITKKKDKKSEDIKTSNDKDKAEDYSTINDEEDASSDVYLSVNGTEFDSITTSFSSLAAAVGTSNGKISKAQLVALLETLSGKKAASDENKKEIAFVKELIAKFDTLSKGTTYITSLEGLKEPQDYETVTQEQVTPPIDIRV